ncbi:MAG: HAD hydrolase-like protein [Sulfitobacter sp.]
MQNAAEIFDRYECVRQRLPLIRSQPKASSITSLLDISGEVDAFVFDAFGVLNVGEVPIPGAIDQIAQLRTRGHEVRVLTNAASFNPDATMKKFKRLGFSFYPEEIITSRSAALAAMDDRHWGVIADTADPLIDIPYQTTRLGSLEAPYGDVEGFLFLSTACWSDAQQEILERSLAHSPRRVVIANADLAAPRGDTFSIEPGYWGHQIADKFGVQVEFFGKPFQSIFQIGASSLGRIEPHKIAMCGDSLHTDILGANAMGWKSVFVTHDGLFNQLHPSELIATSGIQPDWITPRI